MSRGNCHLWDNVMNFDSLSLMVPININELCKLYSQLKMNLREIHVLGETVPKCDLSSVYEQEVSTICNGVFQ